MRYPADRYREPGGTAGPEVRVDPGLDLMDPDRAVLPAGRRTSGPVGREVTVDQWAQSVPAMFPGDPEGRGMESLLLTAPSFAR